MIWYVSHKTLSQQQQEAIRWYNNWPPAPPKKPAHPPPFYINCFRFTLRTPPPSPPSGRWAQIETTKQTNFDIMSFTMKSKSLFLCLSIPLYPFYLGYLFELNWIVCQSLFLRCPPEPNRTRWYPYFSSLFCFFVAPLSPLRSAPPRPSHIVQFDSRTRGIQSIFTTKKIYYNYYYYYKSQLYWAMDVGNLGEGDLPLHTLLPPAISRSRPAGIHQIEVLPIYLLLLLLYYCFHLPLFNTLVFFLTEKTFQRQSRLLLLPLDSLWAYPEMEPRRLAA